jgi:hypothetical protein
MTSITIIFIITITIITTFIIINTLIIITIIIIIGVQGACIELFDIRLHDDGCTLPTRLEARRHPSDEGTAIDR